MPGTKTTPRPTIVCSGEWGIATPGVVEKHRAGLGIVSRGTASQGTHSIVGGCSGGGPREEQEVRERLPEVLSYLRLQCLLTIWTPFFKAAHWPI